MKRYNLGSSMTQAEQVAGWIYLPFYVFFLSLLLSWLFSALSWSSGVRLNAVYFGLNLLITLLIFHRFLWNSLCGVPRHFWNFLQALILGFVLYYAAMAALGALYAWLFPGLVNPNNAAVDALAGESFGFTAVITVLIAPIVEETLMRGLVFGSVQRKSRVWAYVCSILLFSFLHVWQFFGAVPAGTIVLAALEYLPAGIALGWTYEKAGNLWAPILLHMAVNAVSLGLLRLPAVFG